MKAFSYIQDGIYGAVGTAAPIIAAIASWQEQMEWALRILAIFAGISVSVVSLYMMKATHKARAAARVEEETENQNKPKP